MNSESTVLGSTRPTAQAANQTINRQFRDSHLEVVRLLLYWPGGEAGEPRVDPDVGVNPLAVSWSLAWRRPPGSLSAPVHAPLHWEQSRLAVGRGSLGGQCYMTSASLAPFGRQKVTRHADLAR